MNIPKLSIFFGGILIAGCLPWISAHSSKAVVFESLESKTTGDRKVYNRIAFAKQGSKDIWMMQQSHTGPKTPFGEWDLVAIVVDTSVKPMFAKYYQFEPGELEYREGMKELPYRASCFQCHNNGPRAIRPEFGSEDFPVKGMDRLQVFLWNAKMKSYGRVLPDPSQAERDQELVAKGQLPFKHYGDFDNQGLKLKACAECHNDGPEGRGALTRQQIGTIEFLVEKRIMPPKASLSAEEEAKLQAFLAGFSESKN